MGKSNTNNKSDKTGSYTDFFYYFFRNILLASIPLVIISAIVLSSIHSSATGSSSSTDTLSFSISSSCTLSSVVDSSHNAELINGTYVSGIGQTTITTLCNDGNGYSIYANGYSNNEEGNNKLVNTENSNFNIISGTAQSGTTSNWAMSLNNLIDDPSLTPPIIENAYNNTYGIVPNEWAKVASLPARATDMIKGSSFTTTYAVYTSSSQYAGTYNGQVKYVLVHPNINKPTLSNLESAFASHGIQPAYQDESGSYFAMQDMTTDICNSVSEYGESTATQLVDTRDNKLYYVTKLADEHCWMTQNLDFNIEANTVLNSNTTDLNVIYNSFTSKYTEYNNGYTKNNGVIYWTPASSATTISFQNTGPVTGWGNSNTEPYSASKTDSTETGHASLSNYYNWTASIASNDSSSLTQDTLNDIFKNPQNSICPKGWRLPTISNQPETTAGSTNEFARLNYLYNNNKTDTDTGLISQPIYFVRGGYIPSSSSNFTDYSVDGLYRSSTIGGSESSYSIDFLAHRLNATYNGSRKSGYSVRCVAR